MVLLYIVCSTYRETQRQPRRGRKALKCLDVFRSTTEQNGGATGPRVAQGLPRGCPADARRRFGLVGNALPLPDFLALLLESIKQSEDGITIARLSRAT